MTRMFYWYMVIVFDVSYLFTVYACFCCESRGGAGAVVGGIGGAIIGGLASEGLIRLVNKLTGPSVKLAIGKRMMTNKPLLQNKKYNTNFRDIDNTPLRGLTNDEIKLKENIEDFLSQKKDGKVKIAKGIVDKDGNSMNIALSLQKDQHIRQKHGDYSIDNMIISIHDADLSIGLDAKNNKINYIKDLGGDKYILTSANREKGGKYVVTHFPIIENSVSYIENIIQNNKGSSIIKSSLARGHTDGTRRPTSTREQSKSILQSREKANVDISNPNSKPILTSIDNRTPLKGQTNRVLTSKTSQNEIVNQANSNKITDMPKTKGKTHFTTIKPIRELTTKEKDIVNLVQKVWKGESKMEEIADIPASVSKNNKPGKLEFSIRNHQDFINSHGEYGIENFVITANDPTYILKNVDRNPDRINYIKIIPGSKNYFIVSGNRMSNDNYYIVTHFEVIRNTESSLKSLLSRGEIVK